MKYLVTGGAGFIGSHLCEALLVAGHSVRILDDLSTGRRDFVPAGAELIVGDVAKQEDVVSAMEGVDGCFHLAAIASVELSQKDWLGAHRVTLGGFINACVSARARKVPIVYASSASTYGNYDTAPFPEEVRGLPISAYGADKLACELHAHVASITENIPTIGLRFFNVFGPRQDPNSPYTGVISIFAKRAILNREILVHGDGKQARDFIFVADIVDGLQRSMKTLEGGKIRYEVINLGTGRATSVNEIAEAIFTAIGRRVTLTHVAPRPGDPRLSVAKVDKARELLGFSTQVTLQEGINELIRYLIDSGECAPEKAA